MQERDVVGLLYRADWTKLTLTGTVRGPEPPIEPVIAVDTSDRPWADKVAWMFGRDGREDITCSLSVAPGQRFRAEDADGSWAAGCDGARRWQWHRERPAGVTVEFDGRPAAPFALLLEPAWLLTGYRLTVEGHDMVCGRPALRVSGLPRPAAARPSAEMMYPSRSVSSIGALYYGMPRWMATGHGDDAVEAVIDAELGILLRCVRRRRDQPLQVTEFLSAGRWTAGPQAEEAKAGAPDAADAPSAFSAPPGSAFGGGPGSRGSGPRDREPGPSGPSLADEVGEVLGTAAKEAAKAVAGIAAGGLGALVRYGPRRRPDPFARATTEGHDPEAGMPGDEPVPGPAGEPGDTSLPLEVVNLLYRAGLARPALRAVLHQWHDPLTALGAVPRQAREAGFGGVGYLIDAIGDAARDDAVSVHEVSTVRMGGWQEFRIDAVPAAGAAATPRGRRQGHASTIASDGTRHWEVLDNRVIAGRAAVPPPDLAGLLDPSWLLGPGLVLFGGTEVEAGGRRAYRVVIRHREQPPGTGQWRRLIYPAVAVVDAETGWVMRLTRFTGGRPSVRQELRDVTALGGDADFGFTPPDGLPVEDRD